MKKFLTAGFAIMVIALSVSGCGKKDNGSDSVKVETTDKNDKGQNTENKENSENIENENNEANGGEGAVSSGGSDNGASNSDDEKTVEVYFPAEAFASTDEDNIKKQAARMGATAKINDDGTVVYTMTETRRKEEFEELKKDLKDECDKLVSSGKAPFLKEIAFDDNMENIYVKVDKAAYEAAENNRFYAVEKSCLGIQIYNFVKPDDALVTLHISDENGNEFYTEEYTKDGVKNETAAD